MNGGALSGNPAPSPKGQPARARGDAGVWTSRRLELQAWLDRNAPSLAELYHGAVVLLDGGRLPGRMRFVAHAAREIGNRLPDLIAGVSKRQRLDYKSRLDVLAEQWRRYGPRVDASLGIPEAPPPDGPSASSDVSVSRTVILEVDQLLRDHEAARLRPIDAARRLFEAAAPESKGMRKSLLPILRQWTDVIRWFVGKAHDSGRVEADWDEDEFRTRFELFERALAALVGSFYSAVDELDEVLEETNA